MIRTDGDPWLDEPDDTCAIRRERNMIHGRADWIGRPEPPKLPEGVVCDSCGSALEPLPSRLERSHRQYRAKCPEGCWPCPGCGFHHREGYICEHYMASLAKRDEITLAQRYMVFCAGCGYWHGGGEIDCYGEGSMAWPPGSEKPIEPIVLSPEQQEQADALLAEIMKNIPPPPPDPPDRLKNCVKVRTSRPEDRNRSSFPKRFRSLWERFRKQPP